MKQSTQSSRGFTIVEILTVVLIIGILAIIGFVAYSGMQQSSREAKIAADLDKMTKAITVARQQKKATLYSITGNSGTASYCLQHNDGTDLAALSKLNNCWARYNDALDKISIAAGMNIRDTVDPWGRPYFIDENEDAGLGGSCDKDVIGVYRHPFVQNPTPNYARELNQYFSGC